MNLRKVLRLSVLALTAIATTRAAAQMKELTAEEIVAKAIQARGGAEKIKAIQSQRITGTISFGPGAEGPFLAEFKRPGKMHNEVTLLGKTVARSFDGKDSGWTLNPFTGKDAPTPMSASDVGNAHTESDFDGPFVDAKTKGNEIELEGTEKVEGKDAYKLKVTYKDGKVTHYFFDTQTFLGVKWVGTIENDGKPITWESLFHDYREVNGVKFAFEVVSTGAEVGVTQKIVLDKIELNAPIDDARFGKPEAAAAAPAGETKPN